MDWRERSQRRVTGGRGRYSAPGKRAAAIIHLEYLHVSRAAVTIAFILRGPNHGLA